MGGAQQEQPPLAGLRDLAPGAQSTGTLTHTLVGGLCRAAGPRAVLEEGQAALAVGARGVVLAPAGQPARRIGTTLAGVPVALAPGGTQRSGPETGEGTVRGGAHCQAAQDHSGSYREAL